MLKKCRIHLGIAADFIGRYTEAVGVELSTMGLWVDEVRLNLDKILVWMNSHT